MTRKDYALIACAIRESDVPPEWLGEVISSFMFILKENNPKFDATRFVEACRAGSSKRTAKGNEYNV